jgi:macrolide transport system ATP-binding/permease protein
VTTSLLAGDESIARLDDVFKTYGRAYQVHALRHCSLDIVHGEYVAIQGPSGSGKTTLLNILGLLDTATSGQYRLAGKDVAGLSEGTLASLRSRHVGFVFQAVHLVEYRTVVENVELASAYLRTDPEARRCRAIGLLRRVGLGHCLWTEPRLISGGERQRVAIARALMNQPSLLLCDEPTGNLDTATSESILNLIDELHAEGLTIVMVTHDDLVASRATRRLRLVDGTFSASCEGETAAMKPSLDERNGRATRARGPAVRTLLAEAWAAVSYRPVRSFLTALATVIGTAALVATLGLASTAAAQVSDRFDTLKATEVRLQDTESTADSILSEPAFPADAELRLARLNGVVASGIVWDVTPGPQVTTALGAVGGSSSPSVAETPILAASPGVLTASDVRTTGRTYDNGHVERGSQVAIIGRHAAEAMAITRVENHPIIYLDGVPFSIIGIVEESRRLPQILFSLVVPDSTARVIWGEPVVPVNLLIETQAGAAHLIGRQAPIAVRPHDPARLRVIVAPEPESLRKGVDADTRNLFVALAVLAIVVGMVGIANASMLAVMERSREIGLRRALGARRRHIFLQFSFENALLAGAGSLLGTFIGLAIGLGTALARQWEPTIPPDVIFLAPLLGTASGIIAGVQPARRAARVLPAQALRS